MASIDSFLQLPIAEQCRVLYTEGEFIMAIRYYGFKVNLYQLRDAMIEVFYNHKLDKVDTIQPLDSHSSRMNFYADQVNINQLLSPQEGK